MAKMVWSIYKNSSLPFEEWEECHTAWFMDRDLENTSVENRIKFMHDGFYPVYYGKNWTVAEVKNGQFQNVENLKVKIGVLVEMDGYWGQYIERFEKRNGQIEVCIGS